MSTKSSPSPVPQNPDQSTKAHPVPSPKERNAPAKETFPTRQPPEETVPVVVPPDKQTRADVQKEKDDLSARIAALKDYHGHGILVRQREAMIALEAILDERLRTGELG